MAHSPVLQEELRYIVNLTVPETAAYRCMERRASVVRLQCLFPNIPGGHATADVVTIYNASASILSPLMDDQAIPHRESLPGEYERCADILAAQGLLPYDREYAREFVYLRVFQAANREGRLLLLKTLKSTLQNGRTDVRAIRTFIELPENQGAREASDVREDENVLKQAGFSHATRAIMIKIDEADKYQWIVSKISQK